MKIQHDFEYDADWFEIADEFCAHGSDYQSYVLNSIGLQFMIWSHDKKRNFTHIQMLEIAEQLDDKGKWFIQTLCDYMGDKAEREDKDAT